MGKKSKGNIITLTFFFQLEDRTEFLSDAATIQVSQPVLRYEDLLGPRDKFLTDNNIFYESYMYYTNFDHDKVLIQNDFEIPVSTIQSEFDGTLIIIIQSFVRTVRDQLTLQIQMLRQQIKTLTAKVNQLPERDQLQIFKKNSLPMMKSTTSNFYKQIPQGDLDICVLFSEPIYEERKGKAAKKPVDFRSEIERLHASVKNAHIQKIKIKCERATIQNLKHIIRYQKPKILHIISHGSKQGNLQFQEDSSITLGCLRFVKIQDIKQALYELRHQLPSIVFINSCYSENIGKSFFDLGVKFVVMINSTDSIDDKAAQIFSEIFYRNLFKGQSPKQAFVLAKKGVQTKHNTHGCCCNHSNQEQHQPDCLWKQVSKSLTKFKGHKLYHVPSSDCNCQLKHQNRHSTTCRWAIQALFHINRKFRVWDQQQKTYRIRKKNQLEDFLFQGNYLMVCCCLTPKKIPHNQSHKFKYLGTDQNNIEPLYVGAPGTYPDIIDETAPQLLQVHEHFPKQFYGRQQQLYNFLKSLTISHQTIFIVYGLSGVGKTSFTVKASSYCFQRRVFELFYYVDLYDIRDKNPFRFTFNDKTKLKYDGNNIQSSAKDRKLLIIFDNCDQFFNREKMNFYQEMNILKSQFIKSKIIIIMKKQSFQNFDNSHLHCEEFQLEPIHQLQAAKMLFCQMRHQLVSTIQFPNITNLIKGKPQVRCPKVIQSICHSFSDKKGNSVTLEQLAEKIALIGKGQNAVHDLVSVNLQKLKVRSQLTYKMLIFISQFSQGLTINDFAMFSLADKQDTLLQIPIKKNWKDLFYHFFEEDIEKIQIDILVRTMIQLNLQKKTIADVPMLKHDTSQKSQNASSEEIFVPKIVNKKQSYFIEQIGKDKFIVKKFIRDYIWKKYKEGDQANHHMKFIFVSFTSILLENILETLGKHHYIHEELLLYNAVSVSGVFRFKTFLSSIQQVSLTQSARFAHGVQIQIQRILSQNKALQENIRSMDPSVYLKQHKQDLMNMYDHKWQPVYHYLQSKKDSSHKIFLCCLENILIYIPSALMIFKAQNSLMQYAINKSRYLLREFRHRSQIDRNLKIELKLCLMLIQCQMQQPKPNMKQIQNIFKDYQSSLSQCISLFKDQKDFQQIRTYIHFQKQYIKLYMDFQSSKGQIKQSLQRFKSQLIKDQSWKQCQPTLVAKKDLILCIMFLQILHNPNSVQLSKHMVLVQRARKDHIDNVLEMLKKAASIFAERNLIKLQIRAKLVYLQLVWQLTKASRAKSFTQIKTVSYSQCKQLVQQCQLIFNNKDHKLKGITQFDSLIKKMNRQIKQKLWEEAKGRIIFMRAIPIWRNQDNIKLPIVSNLVRKKNNFKHQLQAVMKQRMQRKTKKISKMIMDSRQPKLKHMVSQKRQRRPSCDYTSVDISTKFQILTKDRLKKELASGCSIIFISTDVKIRDKDLYLTFQGSNMEEQLVSVGQNFFRQYDFSKPIVVIFSGQNTLDLIRKISNTIPSPPLMIALSEKQQIPINLSDPDQVLEKFFLRKQNKRRAILEYAKQFMKKIKQNKITHYDQLLDIHLTSKDIMLKFWKDFDIEMTAQKFQKFQIDFRQGNYKDLSPGYQQNHNLQLKLKKQQCVYRRWRQLNSALSYLLQKNQDDQAAYINIYGQRHSGKTFFIQEMAKILIQKQMYNYGVYLFSGIQIACQFQSDFQQYISYENDQGKLPDIDYFRKCSQKNLILFIDDFHLIKTKTGVYNDFLEQLLKRKINIVVTTNQERYLNEKIKTVRNIKIQKLNRNELNLMIYNCIDYSDENYKKVLNDAKQALQKNKKFPTKILSKLKRQNYIQQQKSLMPHSVGNQMRKIYTVRQ